MEEDPLLRINLDTFFRSSSLRDRVQVELILLRTDLAAFAMLART